MWKQIVVVLIVICCLSTSSSILAEEQFRFSNWPLADFEQREILKPFSIQDKHLGVDVEAQIGEEVIASADGIIYWTYSGGAHGIAVGIEHENGWRTTYSHLSERLVKKGQLVKSGEVIGKVGITGTGRDSEKAHLHFALVINPKADIQDPVSRYGSDGPLNFGPLVRSQPTEQQPLQQPVAEQSPLPQIITPISAPPAPITLIQQPVGLLQPLQSVVSTLSVSQKDLKNNNPATVKESKIKIAGEKIAIKKQLTIREKISLTPLAKAIKIFQKAHQQHKLSEKIKKPMIKLPVQLAGIQTNSSNSKIREMVLGGLLLLILLLANFIRKSYNVILT